jgi:hypothetical protein
MLTAARLREIEDQCRLHIAAQEPLPGADPREVASLVRELVAAREVVEAARFLDESYHQGEHVSGRSYHDDLDRLPSILAAYDSAAADQQGRNHDR